MSGIARAALPALQKAWPLLVAHWPKIVHAALLVSDFIKKHPELPDWIRARATGLQEGFAAAARKRGTAQQILATLAVIRTDLEQAGDDGLDASAWLGRASAIERGLRLADRLSGSARRAALADLKTRTDALAADLLAAVVGAPTSTGPSADEGPTPE